MTDDEMRRKMEFIVEQQAQFAVNIEQMRENVEQLREAQNNAEVRMGKLEGAVVAVVDMIGRLTKGLERTNDNVAALAEAQARTDERLNVFITVVERYISEGRNGKSQS